MILLFLKYIFNFTIYKEIFTLPMLSPSGNSYESDFIIKHLNNNNFDPTTR